MADNKSGRKKGIALLIVGMVLGATLITPAGAHISSVSHTWKKHFLPLAKKVFYTKKQTFSKTQANNRFLRRPTAPGTYRVNGGTWIDADSSGRVDDINFAGDQTTWCTQTGGSRAHQQIFLPQGATVTSVSLQYQDNSAVTSSNGNMWVSRSDILGSGGSYADLTSVPMPNTTTPGELATSTVAVAGAAAVIDNTKYTYMLIGNPSGTASLCSAMVTYNQPGAPTTGTPTTGVVPSGTSRRAADGG